MAIFDNTEIRASDGQLYRYLGTDSGGQWAKVNPSGKTGQMARRSVSMELDRLAAAKNYTTRESVFDNLLLRGIRTGNIPARTQEARDWFRNIAKDQTTVTKRNLLTEKTRMTDKITVGKMYFFAYDPIHAKTLPYYDTFPLIFPIEKYSDGYLGINFHYLPLNLRAKLMDALYSISNNKKYDESTKLQVSYNLLKSATKYKMFAPTVHKYLYEGVKSKFIEVYSSEWDLGLFLPVAQFKKAKQEAVWRDSRNKIK